MAASRPPRVVLVGVNGEEFILADNTSPSPGFTTPFVSLQKGATGLDAPEFAVQTDAYPNLAGEFVRGVRASAREVFLPLKGFATDRPSMVALKRALGVAVNPYEGLVRLIAAEDVTAGVTREAERYLDCYYVSGLEGDEGESNGYDYFTRGLILRATNPLWQGIDEITVPFSSGANFVPFFQGPSLPFLGDTPGEGFQLAGAGVGEDTITVDNVGDQPTYPTYTFVGPMQGPFQIVRTGLPGEPDRSLGFSDLFVLGDGENATLVTDPRALSVSSSSGGFSFAGLGTNGLLPDFWPLRPGENEVRIENADSSVPVNTTMTYRPQYLGM